MVEAKVVRIVLTIDAFLVVAIAIVTIDNFILKLRLYPSNSCV
jgi:hypothetical protein